MPFSLRSLALILLLASCSASSNQGTSKNQLVIGLGGDPSILDPAFSYDGSIPPVVNQISEGLLKFKDGRTIEPNLAEKWERLDAMTYLYQIRQGVTFQDGSPMTTDDVLFSMERIRDPKTASPMIYMYTNVDKIEKVDEWTIKVTLKQPDAFWQYVPATAACHVISKAHYNAHLKDFGKAEGGLLGTGPFRFISWTSGSEIVLERYDGYWDKKSGGPYLDKLIYKIVPDANTQVIGLKNGELGMLIGGGVVPLDQLPILEKMPNLKVIKADSALTLSLAFNVQRPPFDNVKVRQALSQALDREAMHLRTKPDLQGRNG